MPTVRRLNTKAPQTGSQPQTPTPQPQTPTPQPQTPTPQPQTTMTQAIPTQAVDTFDPNAFRIELPKEMKSSITSLPQQDVQASAPYIGFVHERNAANFDPLKPGDIYLAYNGVNKQDPLKFWLVDTQHFFTQLNDADMSVKVAAKEVDERDLDRYQEHFPALIIVDTGTELVPAFLDSSRNTRSVAVKRVINEIQAAANPDWIARSQSHQIAGSFPAPWGRVTAEITSKARTANTGRIYYPLTATCTPTTIPDLYRLAEAMKSHHFLSLMSEVRAAYDDRIAEISAKVR